MAKSNDIRLWVRITEQQLKKIESIAKIRRWSKAETVRYAIDMVKESEK